MTNKKVEKVWTKLSHREHILKRPERYIGPAKPRTEYTWAIVNGALKWGDYTYRPALLKMFDEIIINSVDFSKTPDGKHLDKIDVTLCQITGSITVSDNGGIPVVVHEEFGGWLPDMLFGELFSSSNYNEDDEELANLESAGQNGEGASLVNVFASVFTVNTCDGIKRFERTWRDNSFTREECKITKSKLNGTTIEYIPDYTRFPTGNPAHDHLMLVRRVHEIAACNPHIQVTLNGTPITGDFGGLGGLLGCDAIDEQPNWKVGLFKAPNGGVHVSYVNSVATRVGGPHIDYVLDKIVAAARPKLKKKYKRDYKPSTIKDVIGLYLVCDVNLPRFNGQTKEEMTTTPSEFGSKWEPSAKFITKACKMVVEWFADMHRELASEEELKKLDEAQRATESVKFYQIEKYSRATSRDRSKCTLFLTEGDSAAKPLGAAADRKIHGIFPLRGKILNVANANPKQVAASKELRDIVAIIGGLSFRGGYDSSKLNYSSVVLAMDADVDGVHIRGLVMLAFMHLWPDFVREGRLKYLETPVVVAYKGKERFEFFNEEEFEQSQLVTKYTRVKYLKGLGSNSTADFRNFITDTKYVKTLTLDDCAHENMCVAFDDSDEMIANRKALFAGVQYQ